MEAIMLIILKYFSQPRGFENWGISLGYFPVLAFRPIASENI